MKSADCCRQKIVATSRTVADASNCMDRYIDDGGIAGRSGAIERKPIRKTNSRNTQADSARIYGPTDRWEVLSVYGTPSILLPRTCDAKPCVISPVSGRCCDFSRLFRWTRFEPIGRCQSPTPWRNKVAEQFLNEKNASEYSATCASSPLSTRHKFLKQIILIGMRYF